MLTCLLNKNRINCFDNEYSKEQLKKWASKDILLCPICNKPYEFCCGKVKVPYFRHKNKKQCDYLYSEPETEEHVKGKKDIYEWLSKQDGITDLILEGYISGTKQRPDIMFKYKDKTYVIEYQCSPISSEYYERHDLYKAAGINDIWICGTEKYFNSNRTKVMDKVCYGYYNCTNNDFIIINESYIVGMMHKVSNYYGLLNEKTLYGSNINLYKFDECIYNTLCGKSEEAIQKILKRARIKQNKPVIKSEGKYLYMQQEKYENMLKENLKFLSNDNWHFYIMNNNSKYKTYKYIMAIPKATDDICNKLFKLSLEEKYFKNDFIHKKLDKIKLFNIEMSEYRKYATDIEYLKNKLSIVMRNNISILEEYNGDFRFIRTKKEK